MQTEPTNQELLSAIEHLSERLDLLTEKHNETETLLEVTDKNFHVLSKCLNSVTEHVTDSSSQDSDLPEISYSEFRRLATKYLKRFRALEQGLKEQTNQFYPASVMAEVNRHVYAVVNGTGNRVYKSKDSHQLVSAETVFNLCNRYALEQRLSKPHAWQRWSKKSQENCLGLIHEVTEEVYEPHTDRVSNLEKTDYGTYILNKYVPSPITPIASAPSSQWFETLERLFPDADERHYMVSYMKHMVSHPETPMNVCPLITGDQGTGKTFLFESVLAKLVGLNNYSAPRWKDMIATHNGSYFDSVLVLVDEVYADKKDSADKLKALVTNEYLLKRVMNKDGQTERRTFNAVITSNDDKPLYMEADDRRYYMPRRIEHLKDVSESADFFSGYSDILTDEDSFELHKILHWLLDYSTDLTDFKHAPMTVTKQAQLATDVKGERRALLEEALKHEDVILVHPASLAAAKIGLSEGDIRKVVNGLPDWSEAKKTGSKRMHQKHGKSGYSKQAPFATDWILHYLNELDSTMPQPSYKFTQEFASLLDFD